MKSKLTAAVAGARGLAGGELLRLLLRHPDVDLVWAGSRSHAGRPVSSVFHDLLGDTSLRFSDAAPPAADVLFLALPHGAAQSWLDTIDTARFPLLVDLSADFRAGGADTYAGRAFVYGLPEAGRDTIRSATAIANPGCFATALQIALLPLAQAGLLRGDIHVSATTGSTGAGAGNSDTTHFTWRHANLSAYSAFTHRHVAEVRATLARFQSGRLGDILFVPHRGGFTRGIHAACTLRVDAGQELLETAYHDFYASSPFVFLSGDTVDVKQVANTNKCLLHLTRENDVLLVTSVLDNLVKGAAGQAVQNMNLNRGLDETAGLLLKPSAY